MMTLNSKKTVCKIGLRMPFLSLISFLYICSLIICFVFISTSISRNAFAGEKAWLGVQVQTLTKNIRGFHMSYGRWEVVFVSEVIKGSPAEQMGIKQDDVILSVNYKDIKNPNEFTGVVSALNPGDKIVLLIARWGEKAQYIEGVMGQSPGFVETGQLTKPLEEVNPVATNMPAKIFAPTGSYEITSVAFSPDGKYIISGGI